MNMELCSQRIPQTTDELVNMESCCQTGSQRTMNSLLPWCCRYLHCSLTNSSCHSHSADGASAYQKDDGSASICPCHHGVSYIHHVPCVLQSIWCAASACATHLYRLCVTYLLEPGSQFLCHACVWTYCVIVGSLWSQLYSAESQVHATAACSVLVFTHDRPYNVLHSPIYLQESLKKNSPKNIRI